MENKEYCKKDDKGEDNDNKHIRFIILVCIGFVVIFIVLPQLINREAMRSVPVIGNVINGNYNMAVNTSVSETLDDSDIWDTENENLTYQSETTAVPSVSSDKRNTVVFPLDINSASADELMMVKGIGEVTANRIVEYRGINGYFYSMDELLNVEGIGEKKLEGFNGYLFIDYDSLPETLPQIRTAENTETEVSVTAVPVTTAVPEEQVTEAETAVKTSGYSEEFVMVTEEFITDCDEEFETEDSLSFDISKWDNIVMTETSVSEHYPVFPLELNSASLTDLTYIKGIGEATAAKIVEYAKTVGFKSVEDLLNVNGIGEGKLEIIRPYVYVNYSGYGFDTSSSSSISQSESMNTGMTSDTVCDIRSVNINTCNADDLMQLPGISKEQAAGIIEFRNEIGHYNSIEELAIPISEEALSKIWNYICV